MGAGLISLPYYRGAADNRALPVPIIYPIYRGDVLRVDDKGIRGLLFEWDRVKLDVSADGTLPGSNDDVEGRQGMPSLDATFQLGPSLTIQLWANERQAQDLILEFPVRAVYTIDAPPAYVGLAASSKLTYHRDIRVVNRDWRISLTGGIELGSDGLHDYFYRVAPEFATPIRAAYNASGGYAGTRFTVGVQSRQGKHWVGAFLRYDRVGGATFRNSPLVRQSANLSAGIVMVWFIARSERMVSRPDVE